MERWLLGLASCLVVAILAAGAAVGARASLDEAALEHDRALAAALPSAVESAFEKRGIGLASSILSYAALSDPAVPLASALEYPAERLPGNNCFAVYFFEEKLSRLPRGYKRPSCQEIVSERVRRNAAPMQRGTLLGDHYVVIYSLAPRFLRLVETTMAAAVRADR